MVRDHQLLVVGSGPPHPLVEQELAACRVHDACELRFLLLIEADRTWVGPPQKASHLDTPSREVDQQTCEGWPVLVEPLVVVAPPVGEVDVVAGSQWTEHVGEPGEVGPAVDQRCDGVAFGPGGISRQRRGPVAAPGSGQEPRVGRIHHPAVSGAVWS
jgi:hypothetical protein